MVQITMYTMRVKTMRFSIFLLLFIFLFCLNGSSYAIMRYEEINGYIWSNMDYREKAVTVISLAKGILVESKSQSNMSPEIALQLCFKTDEFYSNEDNLKTSILNAWLKMSKNYKTMIKQSMIFSFISNVFVRC